MHGGTDASFATLRALRMIAGEVQRQALVMSYLDGFWIMGFGLILASPLVLLLKRPTGTSAVMAH
jgi:DHA2 family multidrug resistance protein